MLVSQARDAMPASRRYDDSLAGRLGEEGRVGLVSDKDPQKRQAVAVRNEQLGTHKTVGLDCELMMIHVLYTFVVCTCCTFFFLFRRRRFSHDNLVLVANGSEARKRRRQR